MDDFQSSALLYLDATQQDFTSLSADNQYADDLFSSNIGQKDLVSDPRYTHPISSPETSSLTSPAQPTQSTGFSDFGCEESPIVSLLDDNINLDFDATHQDFIIDDLTVGTSIDLHEKRKSPDGEHEVGEGEGEGSGKRREGEDKQAKKPGRKPLTSEPTTIEKRKAQNRAAQRAFRERKEKHLKDLETKVEELEKASDVASQENGLLRAQVQRLQVELVEYRKRLSINRGRLDRSPPRASDLNSLMIKSNNNFSFEFPRFGELPGAQLFDNGLFSKTRNGSLSSNVLSPQSNTKDIHSATTQRTGSITGFPGQIGGGSAQINASHSNSLTNSTPNTNHNSNGTDGFTASPSRIFQFNSGSSTHSGSVSASSTPMNAVNSSCDTSPASSHNSPSLQKDTVFEGSMNASNPEAVNNKSSIPPLGGIDFFADRNGGQFDPTLFGGYRDTQLAIVGDGDFSNGFFNEAFLNTDYTSSFHFGDTLAARKPSQLEEHKQIRNGQEETVSTPDPTSMLDCRKIWDKLASCPAFEDGTIDIDNLCAELRAKARCSESGVVIDQKDIDAALRRRP